MARKERVTKVCVECSKEFKAYRAHQKFCKLSCKNAFNYALRALAWNGTADEIIKKLGLSDTQVLKLYTAAAALSMDYTIRSTDEWRLVLLRGMATDEIDDVDDDVASYE